MLPRQGYKAIPWQNETEVGRNMPRQRSGQISVEALAPHARLWELVLNDMNDGFFEVPGVCHEGQPPSLTSVNPPAMVEVSLFRSPLKCMYMLHLAIVPEGMNI
ncbi:hypothetical protein V6N13_037327 [Hibiscus sabdariffa]